MNNPRFANRRVNVLPRSALTDHRDNRIHEIPIGDLHIDQNYQRPLSEGRVRQITKDFKTDKLGALMISQRDGHYYVIDGQHRLVAARKYGLRFVPCVVYYNLNAEDEATLRLAFNTRKPDTAAEIFRLQLARQDAATLAVKEIVEDVGLRIHLSGGTINPRAIRCVGILMRIYSASRNGDQLLAHALTVDYHAWPDDYLARAGHIIQGLATFLNYYPDVSDTNLVRKLSQHTPASLLASAKTEAATTIGIGREKIIASILLRLYNSGKRTCRLPNRITGR